MDFLLPYIFKSSNSPLEVLIIVKELKHVLCYLLIILLQILAQHIKALLPGLRARISAYLVTLAKEHASYGEITESKACVPMTYQLKIYCITFVIKSDWLLLMLAIYLILSMIDLLQAGQGALLLNILSKYCDGT